jgi:hypothetical protein
MLELAFSTACVLASPLPPPAPLPPVLASLTAALCAAFEWEKLTLTQIQSGRTGRNSPLGARRHDLALAAAVAAFLSPWHLFCYLQTTSWRFSRRLGSLLSAVPSSWRMEKLCISRVQITAMSKLPLLPSCLQCRFSGPQRLLLARILQDRQRGGAEATLRI